MLPSPPDHPSTARPSQAPRAWPLLGVPTPRTLVEHVRLLALGGALLVGCGRSSASIQPDPKATGTAAVVNAPEPTVAPTGTPKTPAPIAPLPVKIADAKIPLQVYLGKRKGTAWSWDDHRIFPVGDEMVVFPKFRVLNNDRLEETPGLSDIILKGEDKVGETYEKDLSQVDVMGVMGRYPDDLWLDVSTYFGRVTARGYNDTAVDRRYTYLRQFGTFGRVPDLPIGAAAWSKRRTLAYLGEGRFRLALNNKKSPDPLPKQTAGLVCPIRVDGKAMTARTNGRVAVVGPDCHAGSALALERWGTGSDEESLSKSEIIALPGAPKEKPQRVWVLMNDEVTYALARFEGRSYMAEVRGDRAVEITPPDAQLQDAHLAVDGTLFVAGQQSVYRYEGVQDQKAVFTAAALPKDVASVAKQFGLFAESHDHLFWAVRPPEGSVILSTHAPPPPETAPTATAPTATATATGSATASATATSTATATATATASATATLSATASATATVTGAPSVSAASSAQASATAVTPASALLDTFPALTSECKTPLVVLFPVPRSTPADFDFAAARADLKDFPSIADVQIIEITRDAERFLVAVVKDEKTATALVAYLTAKKKEPAPRAVCFAVPKGSREIR